jgi:hypothetical protein
MKDQLKRWNQLAGTDKKLQENKQPTLVNQELYGNQFMNQLLNEDLADALKDKKKDAGEEDEGKDAGEEDEGKDATEEKEEEESEIGDDEDGAKTSAAELKTSLKTAAGAIADAVPAKTRDSFVDVFNKMKDVAADGSKAKMEKIANFIARMG